MQPNPLKTRRAFAYFCGAFSYKKNKKEKLNRTLSRYRAVPLRLSEEDRNYHTLYFYRSVVDNSYDRRKGADYRIPLGRTIRILPDMETTVCIDSIDVYLIEDMLIYSICLIEDGLTVDAVTAVNQAVRNINAYIRDGAWQLHADWAGIIRMLAGLYDVTADPEKRIASGPMTALGISRLVEHGNKMKIYQCLAIDESELEETWAYSRRNLLFEIATGCPMYSSIDKCSTYCPSADYLQEIQANNLISCFDNWDGLALRDTFTLLSYRFDASVFRQFRELYYRHIFVNTYYIDQQLIRFNNDYRNFHASRRQTKEKFLAFHQQYNYDRVSYNFLPQLIYEKMRFGLGVNEETQHLEQQLQIAAEKDEKARDNSLNLLVFLLSAIALISAIKDGSDLVIQNMELFPESVCSYRALGGVVLSFAALAIVFSFIYRSTK